MKKISPIILLLIMITTGLKSQDIDSVTLSKLKLNFVVPDMPAFKTLDRDPSDLLSPSTVKALAVSLSSFNDKGKFIIPKAFALEISPALLINSSKEGLNKLSKYADNRVMNSLRISVGSSTDTLLSKSTRNLALGLRISLIDKGDPTTDKDFQKIIAQKLREIRKSERYEKSKKEFAKLKDLDPEKIDLDSLINANLSGFNKYFQDQEDIQKPFEEQIKDEKEKYRKKHWNDDKLDIAVAIMSSSPDSVLKNVRFHQINFWGFYAIKAGQTGQFIFGISGQVYKNLIDTAKITKNKTYTKLSIPARYLIGTNRVKGFAELQYSYASLKNENKLLVNLGSELNIIDGIWINIYAGLDYSSFNQTSTVVANLNLKLTLPENFKFF